MFEGSELSPEDSDDPVEYQSFFGLRNRGSSKIYELEDNGRQEFKNRKERKSKLKKYLWNELHNLYKLKKVS